MYYNIFVLQTRLVHQTLIITNYRFTVGLCDIHIHYLLRF